MRFLIYGAGAIGQAIGCLLAGNGHRVDLVLRPRFIEAIGRRGLAVSGLYGDFRADAASLGLHESTVELTNSTYDYAIITTKTYDTPAAVADLAALPNQDFYVVSMQNGCGNLEQLVAAFGEKRALAARVITGFEIREPGRVTITVSADDTHIGGAREGDIPPAAERLAAAVAGSGLPCIATPTIGRDLFAKLLYNCALNPLGAILGVHYGALAEDSETRPLMDAIIDETFAVLAAMKAATHWQSGMEYREFFYETQIPATYHHRSSMLQDLENNKPTEVDAMSGNVASRGQEYGVPTPVCDMVSRLVRFLEKKKSPQ